MYYLLPGIAFLINLSLAIFIIYRNPRNRMNIIYAAFTFALGLWSLGDFLVFTSTSASSALQNNGLSIIPTSLVPAFILHFSLIFTGMKITKKRFYYIPFYMLPVFWSIMGNFTNLISKGVEKVYWGYNPIHNIL